jgi:hypothetical protein
MRILSTFGLIMFLFINCSKKANYNDLKLNAKIIDVGWDDNYELYSPICYQYVNVELRNYSKVPRSFWIMKCSWQFSFITDVDNIKFLPRECLGNYPIQIQLKPNHSISFSSIISVPDSIRKNQFFRIGFVMFNEKDLMDYILTEPKTKKEYIKTLKTYWSDSLPILPRPQEYKGYTIK